MTFVGCENELPYGTVGIINNKIISFNRNIIFDSVNIKNKKNFKAFIYSGISVMNINILNRNYKWLENFEKSLYPLFIKKFKCNFVTMKGFWHSIDNKKDINSLNEKGNKIKFRELTKITKKFE
jgi:NDP-sugar pyrophosphorylase family protein